MLLTHWRKAGLSDHLLNADQAHDKRENDSWAEVLPTLIRRCA